MMKQVTILAIETSCDETAVAVMQKEGDEIKVLAQAVASQIDVHRETGGVIPEVAAREHVAVLQPMLRKVIGESGVSLKKMDAIAVTVGPGLMPALSVGVTAAQTLAFALEKQVIPVHHIEGHIYSALLSSAEKIQNPKSKVQKYGRASLPPITYYLSKIRRSLSVGGQPNSFPALALIVSGGHTMLVEMTGHLKYKVLGSTRDDAAGEAFDKVARLLGLSYPGGPAISELAKQGDPAAFKFARPMIRSGDLDFSFSGLKTEVLYTVREMAASEKEQQKANLAASFQQAVVDTLVGKTAQAIKQKKPELLMLAGGVAANQLLRTEMQNMAARYGINLNIAPLNLCGDNAVMIGLVGLFAWAQDRAVNWDQIDAAARIDLEKFSVKS